MNILFVLYHDFTANSASHVCSFAEELSKLGHDCCVAVPNNKSSRVALTPTRFHSLEFEEFSKVRTIFSDGRGPDIIHAWTPREIVRIFCERVRSEYGSLLFIHLEDNEWHILSCFLRRPEQEFWALESEELDALIPLTLSHPHRATAFMKSANGITIIIDRLAELVPPEIPMLEIWPSADPKLFFPKPRDKYEMRRLGIPENCTVLAYTGNVHIANAHEMRSLYLAVAVLNREGFPTTLVRAGRDFCPFLGPSEEWARPNVIELGYLPHRELGSILALADVLVQPGKSDPFNDYRFPSKLPEFLSVGRPVILPDTNIARHMTHREHAYILEDPSAVSIASAVKEVMFDLRLYETLSAGSLEFFNKNLSWSSSALKLQNFYVSKSASHRVFRAGATCA